MTEPHANDRQNDRQSPPSEPVAVADTAPPLVPSEPFREQSPWWSAPSGKPFGIPDFAHEFAARAGASLAAFWAEVLAWLFPGATPVPVRVKSRRRRTQ